MLSQLGPRAAPSALPQAVLPPRSAPTPRVSPQALLRLPQLSNAILLNAVDFLFNKLNNFLACILRQAQNSSQCSSALTRLTLSTTQREKHDHYPHPTNGETEAQGGLCPESRGQ